VAETIPLVEAEVLEEQQDMSQNHIEWLRK
jgi:hypothetical protein